MSEVPEMPGTLLEKFKFSVVAEVPETLSKKSKFFAIVRSARDARDSPR